MTEFLFATGVMVLAAAGLGLGLVLRGRPPQASCGAMACATGGACDGCPRRRRESQEDAAQ